MFILLASRHAMFLQCANIYVGTGHSNTKYNTKYNLFGLGSLRDTLGRFTKVNHDLTTQLPIIITGFWPQILYAMYGNISKMAEYRYL